MWPISSTVISDDLERLFVPFSIAFHFKYEFAYSCEAVDRNSSDTKRCAVPMLYSYIILLNSGALFFFENDEARH